MLERYGYKIVKEKGSIRYYGKPGNDKLIIPIRFQVETKYGMVTAWPDHEKSTKNW